MRDHRQPVFKSGAHLDLADDEQRVLAVAAQQGADIEVRLSYPRPRVVPPHDLLACCSIGNSMRAFFSMWRAQSSYSAGLMLTAKFVLGQLLLKVHGYETMGLPRTIDLLVHGGHVFQVAVVQEPDGRVAFILLEWDCK
jgi:hypothetical protein